MRKIKDNKSKDHIVAPIKSLNVNSVLFSFKYMSSNKKLCFKYFGKDVSKSKEAYESFFQKISEICQLEMQEILNLPKNIGLETIPYKDFQACFSGIDEIVSNDSKLTVFRFKSGNYRIICKQDINHQNIFYVLGFDFNFSVYTH